MSGSEDLSASRRLRRSGQRKVQDSIVALSTRFEILGELGRGGMGVVLRARDPEAQREVALKVLLERGGASSRRRERFLREGAVAARLHHPGIVTVHSAGEVEGVPYLVYEKVPGARALDEAWEELDLRARLGLLVDVAKALGHAHAEGIVHRDLKPANVLVDSGGRARVTDFGLALPLDQASDGGARLTQAGATLGTPSHMAPEQAAGGEVGPPADVYGLGILLHEAVAGSHPYEDERLTPLELLVRLRMAEVPPLRERTPGTDPALEAIARRALQRDPRKRYADGAAFALDLERYLTGQSPRGLSGGWLVLAALAGAAMLLVALRGEGAQSRTAPSAVAATRDAQVTLGERADEALALEGVLGGGAVFDWLREAPLDHDRRPELEARLRRLAREPLWTVPQGHARAAGFTREGDLVLASADGTIARWDLGGGASLSTWKVEDAGNRLAVHPDGSWAFARRGYDFLWLCPTGRAPRRVTLPRALFSLRFTRSGDVLVGTEAGGLLRVDPQGALSASPALHPTRVYDVLELPSGAVATAAGGLKMTSTALALWERSGALIWRPQMVERIDRLGFEPRARLLVAGHYNGMLLLFRLDQRDLLGACESPDLADPVLPMVRAHRSAICGLEFSPDGRVLYSAAGGRRGGELRAWAIPERRLLGTRGAGVRYRDLALSPRGRWLAAVRADGRAQVWSAAPE